MNAHTQITPADFGASGDLVPITHWVPQENVLDFQREAQALLNAMMSPLVDSDGAAIPDAFGVDWPLSRAVAISTHPDAWTLPHWGPADEERAIWLVAHLAAGSDTRNVLAALTAAPDGADGHAIAAAAGIEPGSLASTLKQLAVLGRRVIRRPMWSVKRIGGINRYSMDPAVRALFAKILHEGGGS